jgi:DNA-binding protein H-NS
MTTTYLDIKAQIKALEEKAEELRKSELTTVIEDIKLKISEYGISAEDLGLKKTNSKKSVTKKNPDSATEKKQTEPKYSNAVGQTWTGRGVAPKWIAEHVANGGKKEDFLILK